MAAYWRAAACCSSFFRCVSCMNMTSLFPLRCCSLKPRNFCEMLVACAAKPRIFCVVNPIVRSYLCCSCRLLRLSLPAFRLSFFTLRAYPLKSRVVVLSLSSFVCRSKNPCNFPLCPCSAYSPSRSLPSCTPPSVVVVCDLCPIPLCVSPVSSLPEA
jgi:hypothetical protein